MTINYEKKAIELTAAEMKEAKKFGSDMYKRVCEARRDFAGFEVKEVKAKKSKSDFSDLNMKTIKAYDCFKRVVKKMGVSELRFHDLRHTYAVISIKNGDDIKTVQNNLGHATASFTLDVYGHVTEQMKRDSSSRMESFIQGLSDLR